MNRDEYYIFQHNYYQLKELITMIGDDKSNATDVNNDLSKYSCQHIIDFLKDKEIDVNSYICPTYVSGKDNVWVPLVFFVSLFPHRKILLKWLLKHRADPRKLPDGDTMNICFYCHEKYLNMFRVIAPPLTDKSSSVAIADTVRHISNKLICGNIRRICLLLKHGTITNDVMRQVATSKNLPDEIINAMISRLIVSLSLRADEDIDKTMLTVNFINKYLIIFKLLLKYGLSFTLETKQLCANNYLYEILQLENIHDLNITIKYHTDMNDQLVSMLRPLFNDYRYVKTCEIINAEPDFRAF